MNMVQFDQPGTPDNLQLKYAAAYYNHGNRLGKLEQLDDAIVYYLKTLDIKPEQLFYRQRLYGRWRHAYLIFGDKFLRFQLVLSHPVQTHV